MKKVNRNAVSCERKVAEALCKIAILYKYFTYFHLPLCFEHDRGFTSKEYTAY